MGEVRFMISEAAKKVQVESHVLRYWEEDRTHRNGTSILYRR